MVRTVVLWLLAVIGLAVVATPGFALLGLFFPVFLFGGIAWWIGLAVITRGAPGQVVAHARHDHLLGPGGPDDPFADTEHDDEQERAL